MAAKKPVKKINVKVFVGKRKRAVARAIIKAGKGVVRINGNMLASFGTRYMQMRVMEPIELAGESSKKYDIDVKVNGGGSWGQIDAVRTAIANAFVSVEKNLKELYLDYDRSMLISDSRRTEPHKPSRSSAGPRRTKQQSKR